MLPARVFRPALRYYTVMKGRNSCIIFVEILIMSWITIKCVWIISVPPGLTHRCLKDFPIRNAKIWRAQIPSGVILRGCDIA